MDTQTKRFLSSVPRDIPVILCDRRSGCCVEGSFRELLSLERMRTERTARPFTFLKESEESNAGKKGYGH